MKNARLVKGPDGYWYVYHDGGIIFTGCRNKENAELLFISVGCKKQGERK